MHSTGSIKNELINNKPGTSNSSFPKENQSSKRRKLFSAVNESSSNEDSQLVQGPGKSTSNTFSDYESGDDDVEKTSCSLICFSTGKTRGVTKKPTTDNIPCIPPSIQFEDSSSGDSDESFIRLASKRGSLRALSDYETGDSIDQDKEALMSKLNQGSNSFLDFSQQNDNLDLSSEDDSVYKVTINKCKNPLSTSDSSDSDAPVRQQRFRKRRRINTSSEEENVNVTQSHRRGITRPQLTRQLRPRINNRIRYMEAESSSSTDGISGSIMRRDNTEITSYSSSSIEQLRRHEIDESSTTNSSDSNEEDVMEGSRFNRIVHSATNVTNTESIHENSIPQTIAFMRRRNNQLETVRTSPVSRESGTSNDEISSINRTTRFSRFDSESRPRQMHLDSSDNENILLIIPRRVQRRIVRIRYSDSDSNSEPTLPEIANVSSTSNSVVIPNPLISSAVKDENSSDSDTDSEKCPICFSCFGLKEVASPESCDHSFCRKCILEWAKSNNTCPIDRKRFNTVMVRPSFNSKVIDEVPVESPMLDRLFWRTILGGSEIDPFNIVTTDISSSEEGEWEEICCVCSLGNSSHNLIVCDFCLDAYHLNCITPPLRSVPVSDWFCPPCRELAVV